VERRRNEPRDAETAIDRAMLERVRAREADALEYFFDRHYNRVYGHVAHMVGDAALAEDLTQEAFLRMHRAIDRLDPEREPTAWIFTVASNTVRDHWRSASHRHAPRQQSLDREPDVASGEPGAHARMERNETQRTVRRALAELGEDDREVILLRSYEDLDSSTVGEILGISPEAVRQRHRRALARLGKMLRDPTTNAPSRRQEER
jgi:RNA polymerase sigma-70 factor (ECF subfamily)